MSLAYLGPIRVPFHGDPDFSWTGDPTAHGTRTASIGGYLDWAVAEQLVELAGDEARRVTVGNDTGVLEPIWFDDGILVACNGWYLIRSASITAQQVDSVTGATPISVALTFLGGGGRQVVVPRSSRALANSFGLAGSEVLAAPLTVSDGNLAFVAEPGGTVVTRLFDAAHGDTLFDRTPKPRTVQVRVGPVGTLPGLASPTVEDDAHPPSWVSGRGGDCRAFDVSQGRAVYGPSHPFDEPSDLVLENGVLRLWCGPRGVVPCLTVAVFTGGAWRQEGVVLVADETAGPVLDRARLVTVTPDRVTAALSVRGVGDVYVSLRRGERMIRVQHGSTRVPTVAASRRAQWLGAPPTRSGLAGAVAGSGQFGSGLDVSAGSPSFQWPTAATQAGWSLRGAWIPPAASATQVSAGLFTLLDSDLAAVATLWFDAATKVLRLEIGPASVVTPALTFAAGAVVQWAAAFDRTDGLSLTFRTPAGNGQVVDRTIVTPVSAKPIVSLAFFGSPTSTFAHWGDGTWGSGAWGGGVAPSGAVDELVAFAGRLTNDQAAALTSQAAQLASMPSNPRPVWYAPFDTALTPAGAALASGRSVESVADALGFKRVAAALQAVTAAGMGVGSSAAVTSIDLMAGLSDTTTGNTAAEMHDQFAAQSQQETRIR